jgi:AraC-like DNA-binding protein
VIFETCIPAFPLSGFIECFIYHKGHSPEHAIDRLLPDGNVVLVIDLTDNPKSIYDNESLRVIQTCRRAWFSGLHTRPLSIPSGRESEMFILSFLKGRAYPFVRVPMSALKDRVVDAELVVHENILSLREQLMEAPGPEDKFSKAHSWLMRHYARKLEANPFINYAVSSIIQSPGERRISEIAAKTGYSQKHLIRLFSDHVGVAPKSFMNIVRFQNTVSHIDSLRSPNWARAAVHCGYYDQSHFIADFKRFSGFTPAGYLQMKKTFPNYVAVG